MRKCKCGTVWTGYGVQPRAKEICEGCQEYLHRCVNCRHHVAGRSECPSNRFYVGDKDVLNNCGEFEINDSRKAAEREKTATVRTTWEELFRP